MGSKKSHGPSILLVDDSEEFIAAARILLRDYNVTWAKSASEALAQLEKSIPDIMFIDLVMPRMSGLELMRIVNERYPTIIMVALTGIDEEETLDTCRGLGVNDYLIKGALSSAELQEVIDRLSKQHR